MHVLKEHACGTDVIQACSAGVVHSCAIDRLHASTIAVIQAYIMAIDDIALLNGLSLAEQIREACPDYRVLVHTTGGRFKSQFKKADKSGARLALILGEEEYKAQTVSIKDLRGSKSQQTVLQQDVISVMKNFIG